MVSFPYSKINLGLRVLSKRSDGFHNIETCFYPVPCTDILEIIPSKEFSFSQSGIKIEGSPDDNLCMKAYKLLLKDFQMTPVKIHLHKSVPMGAGLGGGSADGAFTLRLLNEIFQLNLSVEQMTRYAAQIGSDCAFFVNDRPMIGTGRGEVLSETSVKLSGYYLVLVKPPIHVSTAEAYSGISPGQSNNSIPEILKLPVEAWKDKLGNDFEYSIFKKYPAIELIKEKLYRNGAIYASMSGSGASVFGIFSKPVDLKKDFDKNDYWSGELK